MIPDVNLQWRLPALMISGACMICAAQAEEVVETCAQLESALREQLQALQSVTNETGVQAALSALSKAQQKLSELNERTDEKELWRYIDNTPGVKQPFITILEDTMVQLQRIEKANFFGSDELKRKLAPMTTQPRR